MIVEQSIARSLRNIHYSFTSAIRPTLKKRRHAKAQMPLQQTKQDASQADQARLPCLYSKPSKIAMPLQQSKQACHASHSSPPTHRICKTVESGPSTACGLSTPIRNKSTLRTISITFSFDKPATCFLCSPCSLRPRRLRQRRMLRDHIAISGCDMGVTTARIVRGSLAPTAIASAQRAHK